HDGIVQFLIQDEGIGIPESEMSQIFDCFYRATNVGNISGTGLGLAVVKKCVDLHQGTISVNSVVNQGTTFTVTLPCIKNPQ
ncbi:MAG: HAMP domain-containing sensor histidine kinase, partial [Scytonema sp. PMC 1069.18]|nr:HAMP domain-containing sensor histidine kinase [Scytonema sp. PMC 1069.18]